jgi:hypothetical protein
MTTEGDFKKQVRDYLDGRGIHYHNAFQSRRGAYGSKLGVSDLIVCYRGRYVALELKAPGKKGTKEQLEFLESVYKSNGNGGVYDNLEDIIELFWIIDKIIDAPGEH